MDVPKEIEVASALAEEIGTLTSEVEEDFRRIEAAATSEEMAHIYECIDNFVDHVLPSMQKDVTALEKVVGSLQMYHETKNKPVNTFLKGIMGGHDEIPKIPRAIGGEGGTERGSGAGREAEEMSMSEAERLIKYTNAITVKDADELHAMIHAKRTDNDDEKKECANKSKSSSSSLQEDIDIL